MSLRILLVVFLSGLNTGILASRSLPYHISLLLPIIAAVILAGLVCWEIIDRRANRFRF